MILIEAHSNTLGLYVGTYISQKNYSCLNTYIYTKYMETHCKELYTHIQEDSFATLSNGSEKVQYVDMYVLYRLFPKV